jgi:dienelactone hydrolase
MVPTTTTTTTTAATATTTTATTTIAPATTAPTATTATTTTATTTTDVPTPPDPERFLARGPWAVGVRTIWLDDRPVEVWYPVDPAAVAGQPTEVFDSIDVISEVLRPFIPGDLGGEVDTGSYRDAPPATTGGRFPVAAYSHGSPGYRQAATFLTSHLASHGVVTIAVEHLGRSLSALLTPLAGGDTPEDDVNDLLGALESVGGDPELGPVVDASRMVVIGHSAGAGTAALATADGRVVGVVSLAGVPVGFASDRPALVVAFENDALIDPAAVWGLHQTLGDSVFLNIAGAGHASPVDACPLIQDRGGLVELREVLGEALVRAGEDGCMPGDADARAVHDLLRLYVTTFVHGLLGPTEGRVELSPEAADLVVGAELEAFNEPPATSTTTAATAPPPTPITLGDAEQLRIVLTGDSIADQVAPHLAAAFGSAVVIERRHYAGTALCDWFADRGDDLGLEHLADWRPHVIIVDHGGNAMTPCMAGDDGEPFQGAAYTAKYLSDSEYLVELALGMGSRVLFVDQPVARGDLLSGTHPVFGSMPERHPGGEIRFVSTWPVLTPDGRFVQSAPCRDDEPGCADGWGALRSPPPNNHLEALGAWRYAVVIVEEFTAAGWIDPGVTGIAVNPADE